MCGVIFGLSSNENLLFKKKSYHNLKVILNFLGKKSNEDPEDKEAVWENHEVETVLI